MSEYVQFYSQVQDKDLHVVIEFVLHIREKNAKAPVGIQSLQNKAQSVMPEEQKEGGEEEKKDAQPQPSKPAKPISIGVNLNLKKGDAQAAASQQPA